MHYKREFVHDFRDFGKFTILEKMIFSVYEWYFNNEHRNVLMRFLAINIFTGKNGRVIFF